MFKVNRLAVSLALIFSTCLFSITQVFALTISNDRLLEQEGDEVTIQVFAPGKSFTDLLEAEVTDYTDILAYQEQTTINSRGEYAFEFALDGHRSGMYKAVVSEPDVVRYENIVYINPQENKIAIQALNDVVKDGKTVADMAAVIKNNKDALGFHIALSANYESEIASYVYTYISKNQLDTDDGAAVLNLLSRAAIASALNSNDNMTNIFDYAAHIDFSKTLISDWYNKNFVSQAVCTDTTSRMKRRAITEENFEDILCESFILAVIKNPDGYANVKDILSINVFCDKIGISPNGKNSTYAELANNNYDSFADLKAAYEKLENSERLSVKPNSSGGGGGGKSENNLSILSEFALQNKPEPIRMEIFNDLSGYEWAKEAIVNLTERKIISGNGDGSFCPGNGITREEFVKMLVNTFFADETGEKADFYDVAPDMWYYNYIGVAHKLGIVKGIDESHFGIGQNISRQDMAVMIYRACLKYDSQYFVEQNVEEKFTDDSEIADYARDMIYVLRANKVISGVGNGDFEPLGNATRADAAMVLHNLLS